MTEAPAIVPADFSALFAEGLIAAAAAAGVTIRPDDRAYRVAGAAAVACLRRVGSSHVRLCGCYVAPECRGRGLGRALVLHRLGEVLRDGKLRLVDTYAFRPGLFLALGFETVRSYKIGTTLLRLRLETARRIAPGPGLHLVGRSHRAEVWHGSQAAAEFFSDMLACDPPWRQGNLSYWSHKAGTSQRWDQFVASMVRHFAHPKLVYLKVGAPEAPQWVSALESAGHRVTAWTTRYVGGINAQVVASRTFDPDDCPKPSESKPAATAIAAWAEGLGIRTVADPCVGLGVMADKFRRRGMFVSGVELVAGRAAAAAALLCGAKGGGG